MTDDLHPDTPTEGRADAAIERAEAELTVPTETAPDRVSLVRVAKVEGEYTMVDVDSYFEDAHWAERTATYRRISDEEAGRIQAELEG